MIVRLSQLRVGSTFNVLTKTSTFAALFLIARGIRSVTRKEKINVAKERIVCLFF